MAGFPEIANRLSRVAKQALDDHGLRPDASAQDAVGDLVTRAAQAVDPVDEAQILLAEEAFERLAAEIATADADKVAGFSGGEIDGRRIEAALIKLCPGFYPFC